MRKFFFVGPNLRVGGPKTGVKLLNEHALLKDSDQCLIGPKPGGRGFSAYPEPPIFLFENRFRDIELYSFYWLVSARMKALLEAIDLEAFGFLECKTQLSNGREGPEYWLCDALRILDAIDKEKSILRFRSDRNGIQIYDILGCKSFIFDNDVIGNSHAFRPFGLTGFVVCDEEFKKTCKSAGMKGLSYQELAKFKKF